MARVTTIAERLREALRLREMSPYRLAKETGISQSYVSRLLAGERGERLSGEKAGEISKVLRVRPEWLLSETGPMDIGDSVVRLLNDRPEWPSVRRLIVEQHPEIDVVHVDAVGRIADDQTVMPERLDVPFVFGFAVVLRDAALRISRTTR